MRRAGWSSSGLTTRTWPKKSLISRMHVVVARILDPAMGSPQVDIVDIFIDCRVMRILNLREQSDRGFKESSSKLFVYAMCPGERKTRKLRSCPCLSFLQDDGCVYVCGCIIKVFATHTEPLRRTRRQKNGQDGGDVISLISWQAVKRSTSSSTILYHLPFFDRKSYVGRINIFVTPFENR